MTATGFTIEPVGPFRLAESVAFLTGFPAGVTLSGSDAGGEVTLAGAFPVDGTDTVAGVRMSQDAAGGPVRVEVVSDAPDEPVRRQVARFLSLDHDGRGFAAVGKRDEVIGNLLAQHPGFRPTGFWSPYEAAAWAILSQRVQRGQAARQKAAIAERFGEWVTVGGQRVAAFPTPAVLAGADLSEIRGVAGRKPEWLRGIGEAALAGGLDADRLRALPREEALASLQRIPGVGAFSATLILVRGAMPVDEPVAAEPRLLAAIRERYALPPEGHEGEIRRVVDGWAPYRSWASVLIRSTVPHGGRMR
jgi:DNA-3-methyladenine glycosylase II